MKKFFFLLLALPVFSSSFGQENDYIKGRSLGISYFLSDFKTASEIRSLGLVRVLDNKTYFKPSQMNPGLAVNYLSGLSKHMDFISSLGGTFVDYPIEGEPSADNEKFMLELTGAINFKLLSDHYWITPFVDLGVGGSKYGSKFAAFIPAGLGLQLNLANEAFILLNSQYRIPVTQNASYHFYHSIGVVGNIAPKKVAPAPKEVEVPVVVVLDRDGDGVVDSLDRCPDVPGLAALDGCPDRDGDGIADIDDKCPDVPGVARYQGCPIPDTDGDGVNDEEDKCPNEPGPASNHGCPVVVKEVAIAKVSKAAENIFFSTNSSKLLEKSFVSLKDVVDIMKENPTYNLTIKGYTDNTGGDQLNQNLSESRAASVKHYLVGNSIDESRITSEGFGPSDPIADNSTSAGRAKNRRVEMVLSNF